MGFYFEREDSTNGKIIKTGDNVIVRKTEEKGFVIAVLDEEYIVSVSGDVRNYNREEIEWVD